MRKFLFLTLIFGFIFNAESFAKSHKRIGKKHQSKISSEYFLQVNLTQTQCEEIVGGECFRRDSARDKPYYHQTKLTIFNNKVFAEQFLQNSEKSTDRLFFSISNGAYKFITTKGNKISFSAKNGKVINLKLLSGKLGKEKKSDNKCRVAEATYGFYQAYDKWQIVERHKFFKDEFNFSGLKEFIIFAEKSNKTKAMALLKDSAQSVVAVNKIRLCKIQGEENYLEKHISNSECELAREEDIEECVRYGACEDYLVVKDCEITFLKEVL